MLVIISCPFHKQGVRNSSRIFFSYKSPFSIAEILFKIPRPGFSLISVFLRAIPFLIHIVVVLLLLSACLFALYCSCLFPCVGERASHLFRFHSLNGNGRVCSATLDWVRWGGCLLPRRGYGRSLRRFVGRACTHSKHQMRLFNIRG